MRSIQHLAFEQHVTADAHIRDTVWDSTVITTAIERFAAVEGMRRFNSCEDAVAVIARS